MTEAIGEALNRTLIKADSAGCSPEGHGALVEGMHQMCDMLAEGNQRFASIEVKLDAILARGGSGSLPTVAKWAAALGTAAAGFWAGYKGSGQ
jgi:hypothetical protein